jgi:hypothetical protein
VAPLRQVAAGLCGGAVRPPTQHRSDEVQLRLHAAAGMAPRRPVWRPSRHLAWRPRIRRPHRAPPRSGHMPPPPTSPLLHSRSIPTTRGSKLLRRCATALRGTTGSLPFCRCPRCLSCAAKLGICRWGCKSLLESVLGQLQRCPQQNTHLIFEGRNEKKVLQPASHTPSTDDEAASFHPPRLSAIGAPLSDSHLATV